MGFLDEDQEQDQVVRISLAWLAIGVLVMVLLGVFGGLLADQIWPAPTTPLNDNKDRIVNTVQKVTISPNQSREQVVAMAERAVVGLALKAKEMGGIRAVGVVVTNDGLVVTSASLPKQELVAIDYDGKKLPLQVVGRDELFGLSYFRIQDGLLSPLDVQTEKAKTGDRFLWLGRSKFTYLPVVETYQLKEWMLPPELGPSGIQRLMRGSSVNESTLNGSPLVDDDGRLVGMITNSAAGLALSGDHILESIERVANGRRENDPWAALGLKVHYTFDFASDEGRRLVVEIMSVTPKSAAANTQLQVSDKIVAINDEDLNWQDLLISKISKEELKKITVLRKGKEITLNIKESTDE